MGAITASIEVQAPCERVWAFVNDVKRNSEWVANVREVLAVTPGPVRRGILFRERVHLFGPFHSEGDWRITRLVPGVLQEHQGVLPFLGTVTVRYTLRPLGGGCRCTLFLEYGFGERPWSRPVDALVVRRWLAGVFRGNLRRAKALIEGEAASAPKTNPS